MSSPTSSPPGGQVQEVRLELHGGRAEGGARRVEVRQGSAVRLVVTSDTTDEIHLHGYDREAAVGPGREARLEFVADQAGLFEVETHESGTTLVQLVVR